MNDIDVFEYHEAFAVSILNIAARYEPAGGADLIFKCTYPYTQFQILISFGALRYRVKYYQTSKRWTQTGSARIKWD